MSATVCLLAVLLDTLLGEPRRFHPVAGFGWLAAGVEARLNRDTSPLQRRLLGVLAVLLLILPFVIAAHGISLSGPAALLADTVLLYLAIAPRSLAEHAARVQDALRREDLAEARFRAGLMVSRETSEMDPQGVARAATESVLENGNDACFAPLFWFLCAGAPGAVGYRLVNTLDAMWGYRTARYLYFGWAAARLDDALNFIPARLTALSYACVGRFLPAWRCWRSQARFWESSNAGTVMATGAGALGVRLGGTAVYHGLVKDRPQLGAGEAPRVEHIVCAVELVRRALWLWLALILCGGLAF